MYVSLIFPREVKAVRFFRRAVSTTSMCELFLVTSGVYCELLKLSGHMIPLLVVKTHLLI